MAAATCSPAILLPGLLADAWPRPERPQSPGCCASAQAELRRGSYTDTCKGLSHIRRASQTPNNTFCWLRSSYSSAQTTLTELLAAPGLCRVLGSMMNRKTCVQHARHWPRCWDTMAKRPPTPHPSPLGSRGTWAKTLLCNTRSG